MAIIASVAAWYMLGMLTRCAAVVMAQRTFQRRAFELAADVAGGAVKEFVLTYQRKSGGKMVEALVSIRGMTCWPDHNDKDGNYQQAKRRNRKAE